MVFLQVNNFVENNIILKVESWDTPDSFFFLATKIVV